MNQQKWVNAHVVSTVRKTSMMGRQFIQVTFTTHDEGTLYANCITELDFGREMYEQLRKHTEGRRVRLLIHLEPFKGNDLWVVKKSAPPLSSTRDNTVRTLRFVSRALAVVADQLSTRWVDVIKESTR